VAGLTGAIDRAAADLPDGSHLLLACEDRYRFCLAFLTAVAAGRVALLPGNRSAAGLAEAAAEFPDAALVADSTLIGGTAMPSSAIAMPLVDGAATAAVAFTSGSTGRPQPHAKTWDGLRQATRQHAARLAVPAQGALLVATVPPWHMYGLEWAFLVATVAPLTLFCGDSFYPADVCRALRSSPGRRILVTTPVHLRALLRSGVALPRVDLVVCATAPLDPALAEAAERALTGRVLEIYGCTEVGTIAHREPTVDAAWRLFDGMELRVDGDRAWARAACGREEISLGDRLALHDDGSFELLGRVGDLVKVAGRRASLDDLTRALISVDGVEDGVMFEPSGDASERLCAVAVAPGLTADIVRRRLAALVDPVFLPRRLRLVDRLPRAASGKLPRAVLEQLLAGDRET
jgi:acyl-coenzyme A synthetase/AMP-(fatty) acid ligase